MINAGALASSAHAQAALDQWARRKGITSNCNILFLVVKAQKKNKIVKLQRVKLTTLQFFVTVAWYKFSESRYFFICFLRETLSFSYCGENLRNLWTLYLISYTLIDNFSFVLLRDILLLVYSSKNIYTVWQLIYGPHWRGKVLQQSSVGRIDLEPYI